MLSQSFYISQWLRSRQSGILLIVGLLISLPIMAQDATPVADSNKIIMAHLNSFSGEVQLMAGDVNVSPLQVGAAMHQGDKIITGSDGRAEIYVVEAGILHLSANSQLIVSEATLASTGSIAKIIRLLKGKCRGVFGKLKTPLQFETPTAAAGIRGTRLMLDAERKRIVLFEGEVAVTSLENSKKKPLMLASGDYLAINKTWQALPLDFIELMGEDRSFDFGISVNQTPYVTTHQQWAAWVARELNYQLPNGWAAYPASLYLDLLSASGSNEVTVDAFVSEGNQKLKMSQDKNGNTTLQASASDPATIMYEIPIPVDGDYELDAQLVGGQQYWSFETITTLLSPPSASMNSKRIGPIQLPKGIYQLAISLPPSGKLGNFKVDGPVTQGAAPLQGWVKDGVLTNVQMAVSMGKLLRLVEVDKLTNEANAADFTALIAKLKERGFIIREDDQPVFGADALTNATLLRIGAAKVPTKSRKRQLKSNRIDELRSPVSPIVPNID